MGRNLVATSIVLAALGFQQRAVAQDVKPADAGPTVNAVWVEREIMFTHMAFTSFYSCDGLRDKVGWILGELGVRPGFQVQARGCSRPSGPQVAPKVRIVAALPVEATPEVLAEIASGAGKRELAARATGEGRPESEAASQFPARVRRVEFRSEPSGRLQDGDCELMEQLVQQVMVPLGARVVESAFRCLPRQVSPGAVQLTVEVLQPVPEAGAT